MADLTARLASEYADFDFFQAVSLLEERFSAGGTPADPVLSGSIRFLADTSLSFPPNDIAGITVRSDTVTFLLSFLGLAGASSPLPVYFSDYMQKNQVANPALQDFVALFNHRLYALFYRAWKKYHFIRSIPDGAAGPLVRAIAALAGMAGARAAGDRTQNRMFAYAGILASASHGPAGLQAILSDFFGNLPVNICPWVPRWAPIPDPPRMGVNARLGINAVAGTHRWDLAGKFRIAIGPLGLDLFETFLPGSENISTIKSIATSYLSEPLDFDIEVQLQSTELIPVVLGGNRARLGGTSSLGRSELKSSVQSIIISDGDLTGG